jgi:ribonuclease HI
MTEVLLVPDGAVSGNPGPGGWAVILLAGDHRKELSGAVPDTTNNRMELTGVIEGLRALTRPCKVRVLSDSAYVVNAHRKGWIQNWQRNGWKTAAKQPVKNVDLWQRLVAAMAPHQVTWHWVKGHAGDPGNERADELARLGITVAAEEARSVS